MFGFAADCCPACGRKGIRRDHTVIAVTEQDAGGGVRFMLPKKFRSRRFDEGEMRDISEHAVIGCVVGGDSLHNHICLQDPRHFQLADLRDICKPTWQGRYTADEGIAGLITDVHVLKSKKDNIYARAKLTDMDYTLQLLIWPQAYKECWSYVSEFQPVVIHGTWQAMDVVDPNLEYNGWDNMELHVNEMQPYNYWATER